MRIIPAILSAAATLAIVYALNTRWGSIPAMGAFFSPQHGFWKSAEDVDLDLNGDVSLPHLDDVVNVWYDERRVPHISAKNERDAFYVQGYLHAKDRLWQMELQAFASAGRLSEILGKSMLDYDRFKRREGMIYAAENALKASEADPTCKRIMDAYTEGVNDYIATLKSVDLPLEYKLLGYKPEAWNNLKTCLLLKYMSLDLAGSAYDIENTNALKLFGWDDFHKMYPSFTDSLDPIIPVGTQFPVPTAKAVAPPDSVILKDALLMAFKEEHPDPDNGSNNWAVSGSKTKSGVPILCNDPHLGLNLPALWYEVQISAGDLNVYGVSIPGAPGVIIGFNKNMGWAVTNGMEDVKDYYRMQFKEGTNTYLYNGSYREADLRVEAIKVKGQPTYYDTIAYTVFGPVTYDKNFPVKNAQQGPIAMRWKAHDASKELLTFYRLNHAKDYDDYLEALKVYSCPAQNFIYAGRDGDIGIWHNGQYPLRWKDQGQFIMPGTDSTYAWQGYIPREELPHIKNPGRGFVSSANQHPTDATYPYNFIADYDLYRGMRINRELRKMDQITPQDMMALQNDNTNLFAQTAIPLFKKNIDSSHFNTQQKTYWDQMSQWDCISDADSHAATIFYLMWDYFENNIWGDDLDHKNVALRMPQSKTTLLWLLADSSMKYVDDRRTETVETLPMMVQRAFDSTLNRVIPLDSARRLAWGRFRGTDIRHMTRALPAFSRMHLNTGGGQHIVNATKQTHGPSWRMVVQMSNPVEAYGIYPGGQSGNPGSKYYDNAVNDWVDGRYYSLRFIDPGAKTQPDMKFKTNFIPANQPQ